MATRSLNKVQLIGNLTRDAEMRYTSSGTAISTFTVATNRTYTNSSGETVEDAEFTNVVAWAKLAEICSQLLKKGMKIYIEGRLQTNKWDDQETGKEMRRTEVVANDMIILGGGSGGGGNNNNNNSDDSKSKPNSDEAKSEMGEDVNLSDLGYEEEGKTDNSTPF